MVGKGEDIKSFIALYNINVMDCIKYFQPDRKTNKRKIKEILHKKTKRMLKPRKIEKMECKREVETGFI
jgi:hypothetical protein